MRIVATDQFLDGIEKSVKNAKEDTSKINYERDVISDADEALEHAKSYWMMGYTWEEIEAILEDMEYPSKMVTSVIKKTQEYAQEVLGEGPFGIKEGQLLKLSNGQVVKVINFSDKTARVTNSEKEIINVPIDLIDVESSKKLGEAFKLRESAKKIFKEAQRDPNKPKDLVPTDTFLEPKQQEEEFKFNMTPTMRSPQTWAPYLQEQKFVDVEEVKTEHMSDLIEMIMIIEEQKKEQEKSFEEAKKKLAEEKDKLSTLTIEQAETAKEIGGILGMQSYLSDKIEHVVVRRFKNLLIGFRQIVKTKEKPAGVVDKLDYLLGLVEEKAPEILEEVTQLLDDWDEANKTIIEKLSTQVAVAKPPKKMLSQDQRGMWSHFVDWISTLWDKIKGTGQKLEGDLSELDSISDQIEEVLAEEQQTSLAASINIAMKSLT